LEAKGTSYDSVNLRSRRLHWNLSLKLLLQGSHSPIYIPGEFQGIWRLFSSGPNHLGFQASRRAQLQQKIQSLEEFALDVQLEISGG
jgi:hypothetical protein